MTDEVRQGIGASGALTLAPGTSLGKHRKYVVLRMLKEGGMAEVYLCSQRGPEAFEKTVAIKRIRPVFWSDHEFARMFINEARLVAGLSHPNVVQILDFDEHDGIQFYAMEYVRGHSLSEVIRQSRAVGKPFPPLLTAQVGLDVAQALDHAHKARDKDGEPLNIVHRDVSPQNILVSFDGVIKLTDFGIAKSRASNTGGRIQGKLQYMSPEQADGRLVDARTDLFALGVVMWEMLTGGQLFVGESDAAVLNAVKSALIAPPARLNPGVPAELSELVMRALDRDPSCRFQTAEEMQRSLKGILARQANSPENTELNRALKGFVLSRGDSSSEDVDLVGYLSGLFGDQSARHGLPVQSEAPTPMESVTKPGGPEPTVSMRRHMTGGSYPRSPDEDPHSETQTLELETVRSGSGSDPGVAHQERSLNRSQGKWLAVRMLALLVLLLSGLGLLASVRSNGREQDGDDRADVSAPSAPLSPSPSAPASSASSEISKVAPVVPATPPAISAPASSAKNETGRTPKRSLASPKLRHEVDPSKGTLLFRSDSGQVGMIREVAFPRAQVTNNKRLSLPPGRYTLVYTVSGAHYDLVFRILAGVTTTVDCGGTPVVCREYLPSQASLPSVQPFVSRPPELQQAEVAPRVSSSTPQKKPNADLAPTLHAGPPAHQPPASVSQQSSALQSRPAPGQPCAHPLPPSTATSGVIVKFDSALTKFNVFIGNGQEGKTGRLSGSTPLELCLSAGPHVIRFDCTQLPRCGYPSSSYKIDVQLGEVRVYQPKWIPGQ